MIEAFLLGVIATSSLTASLFFFVYWRRSRDVLFLAFAVAFAMLSFNQASLLGSANPSEANATYYLVRLIAFLIILAGILRKNYGRSERTRISGKGKETASRNITAPMD
ncbi:MAG TPA: DUF5985 family protein [Terracidiphilus sp.]|nr:DUF5985 family protein [Terracidiphilus sp.]